MLLEQEGINPESVLIVCNSELVTLEDHLDDEDIVKILSVISGG